jgi:hypothetical protein
MDARRAHGRGTIARVAIAGALAVTVLLGGAGLGAISSGVHASDPHHAAVTGRDAKVNLVAATTSRTRGNEWFASLLGAVACAALGAQLLRTRRGRDDRRDLRRLSHRLRAPPRLLVAH